MRRREFITLLSGAAATWPLGARAQQTATPVIGFLSTESPGSWADQTRAFLDGLSDGGYVEGRNVLIEYRWAEGHYDRLPELTAYLVHRQVAVIVANGPAALTAKAATSTIPVVFLTGVDPIYGGLVDSLNRPGGNLTGVSLLNVEIVPKRLELLHELVPRATTMALLINPTNPNAEPIARDLQAAAHTRGLQLLILHASAARDFDAVFASLIQLKADALVIGTDPFFISESEHLASRAARHAVPAIFQFREFAAAGGLISYGGNNRDQYRQ